MRGSCLSYKIIYMIYTVKKCRCCLRGDSYTPQRYYKPKRHNRGTDTLRETIVESPPPNDHGLRSFVIAVYEAVAYRTRQHRHRSVSPFPLPFVMLAFLCEGPKRGGSSGATQVGRATHNPRKVRGAGAGFPESREGYRGAVERGFVDLD